MNDDTARISSMGRELPISPAYIHTRVYAGGVPARREVEEVAVSSLAELRAELVEVTEQIGELKERRRALNVAINQAVQDDILAQREQARTERLARTEALRAANAADREQRYETAKFDQFTIDSAKRLNMTPQEFLDLQERRRAEMRNANPGDLPNGGLG